jgi:hypothetical protein
MTELAEAQAEMRRSIDRLQSARSIPASIGGFSIYPVTVLVLRLLGSPASIPESNPLREAGFTIPIVGALGTPVAGAAGLYDVGWFYPAFKVVMGAHCVLPSLRDAGLRPVGAGSSGDNRDECPSTAEHCSAIVLATLGARRHHDLAGDDPPLEVLQHGNDVVDVTPAGRVADAFLSEPEFSHS